MRNSGYRRLPLSQPTRNLRFNEEAVEALQAAERNRTRVGYRPPTNQAQGGSGWQLLMDVAALLFRSGTVRGRNGMANAHWDANLFRPNRHLQLSDAAVQALRSAERQGSRRTPRALRREGSEEESDSMIAILIVACIVVSILDFYVITHRPANVRPVAAASSAPEAIVQRQGRTEVHHARAHQRAARPATAPRHHAVPQSGQQRRPLPHNIWTATEAGDAIPVYNRASFNVPRTRLFTIKPGTRFWVADSGKVCLPGATWKRALLTNPTMPTTLTGVICTVHTSKRRTAYAKPIRQRN